MLSEQQVLAIKKQLIEHIEKTFPDEKKDSAMREIEKMDNESLEDFIVKNNLFSGQNKNQECIFCSIIFGDVPSYKIDETPESVGVLEINPISKGHSLIIPKKHVDKESAMPKDSEKLAKKIAERIKTKLKPERVDTLVSSMFGHSVINILPVYSNENFSSKRNPAKKDELEEMEKILKAIPKVKNAGVKKNKKTTEKTKDSQKQWLPQRIP